jgi:hypothetical protein
MPLAAAKESRAVAEIDDENFSPDLRRKKGKTVNLHERRYEEEKGWPWPRKLLLQWVENIWWIFQVTFVVREQANIRVAYRLSTFHFYQAGTTPDFTAAYPQLEPPH